MSNYSWINTTIGMVLALGMTRLLGSSVAVFRSRHRAALHWVPPVWAACIFYSMLNFSWDLHTLGDEMAKYSFARALILFGFAVVLFLAGALVLPNQELPEGGSLRTEFAQDGRWALVFLALYDGLCILFNWLVEHVSPLSSAGVINLVLAVLALGALKTSSPRWEGAVTVLYAVCAAVFAWLNS